MRATSAGMNGRIVGLPVHAVVCTQKGQWQEMPSSFSLAFCESLLDLLGGFEAAFVVLEHEIGRLRSGRAGFLGVSEKIA